MIKKTMCCLLCLMMLFVFISMPVYAESKSNVSELHDRFLECIHENEIFRDYENRVSSVFVDRAAITEFGVRRTVSYKWFSKDDEQYLVFVGNEEGEIDVCEL